MNEDDNMMKKLILFIIWILPFLIGRGMSKIIMLDAMENTVLPYGIIGIVALVLWFLVGKYLGFLAGDKKKALLIVQGVPAILVVVDLFSVLFLGEYLWMNPLFNVQLYYLPVTSVSGMIAGAFARMLSVPVISPVVSIVSLIMVSCVFYSGCKSGRGE